MAIRELLWMGRKKVAFFALLGFGILLIPLESQAQLRSPDLLHQFSDSLENVTRKVSPAVVQIIVTGYGPMRTEGKGNTSFIGRQCVTGSGVIIDPEGYIVTNAHVVSGAQMVQVLMYPPEATSSPVSVMNTESRCLNARIVD
jgi:serine protease Do